MALMTAKIDWPLSRKKVNRSSCCPAFLRGAIAKKKVRWDYFFFFHDFQIDGQENIGAELHMAEVAIGKENKNE